MTEGRINSSAALERYRNHVETITHVAPTTQVEQTLLRQELRLRRGGARRNQASSHGFVRRSQREPMIWRPSLGKSGNRSIMADGGSCQCGRMLRSPYLPRNYYHVQMWCRLAMTSQCPKAPSHPEQHVCISHDKYLPQRSL
jgi:hypothetical protein